MNRACKKIEEYLVDYLYQELAAKKTLEVEKHLRTCNHCTQTLESWRAIHRAYQRSTEEPQIASYTKQKILAVAEEELLRSPTWSERLLWGLKIATIPVAIFVIVLFLNATKQPELSMTQVEPKLAKDERPVRQDSDKPAASAPVRIERKLQLSDSEPKRKASIPPSEDQLSARGNEARSGNDDRVRSLGYVGESEAPAAPEPAATEPPALDSARSFERDEKTSQQEAIAQQKFDSVASESKKAELPFEEAQKQFRSKNVKEGQNLLRQAISYDDGKSLASKLHEQGSTYQNQGEYGLAITQYENVQSNYKDYARMDDVLLRLGDSYAEVGEFNKAVNAYTQVSPAQRKVASERIQRLQKKREAQQQLESLGYISEPKKND